MFIPKPGDGFLSRILRQQRVLLPGLVDVLEDDKGLGDGFIPIDDEHRYLLVHGIEFQKQRTLVLHVFFHVLVLHPLQLQSPFNPCAEEACSFSADQLHCSFSSH
ncbi:hypothetical protein U1Q18_016734 [Sarracenia purpurea var. burkii]